MGKGLRLQLYCKTGPHDRCLRHLGRSTARNSSQFDGAPAAVSFDSGPFDGGGSPGRGLTYYPALFGCAQDRTVERVAATHHAQRIAWIQPSTRHTAALQVVRAANKRKRCSSLLDPNFTVAT